jgi:hypothetical protein
VKIVERLTKSKSKKKKKKEKRNKSHEASYIVVEVGGTSTFVTHDVTKIEVRWAEIHLKVKSHTPKERGCLTSWTSTGLSDAWGRAGLGPWPAVLFFFHYFFWYFRFCICFAFFFWCSLFCTCTCLKLCFFGSSLYFFVPTYGFKILFKLVASSIFFCTSIFSN